jgi:hypothetical protein
MKKKIKILDKHQHLALARKHLQRVQAAWDAPTDWEDLTLYGFYCVENAVCSAALHFGVAFAKTHQSKAEAAKSLAKVHNLPDVSGFLGVLNDARKAYMYGDIEEPDLIAEEVAADIEQYVDKVESVLEEEI